MPGSMTDLDPMNVDQDDIACNKYYKVVVYTNRVGSSNPDLEKLSSWCFTGRVIHRCVCQSLGWALNWASCLLALVCGR